MNNLLYKKGFTLIETLVALSIFSVSIVGIIVVSGQGLNDVNFVKTRFVASYFAQEALESARNARDTNMLTLPGADVEAIWYEYKNKLTNAGCFDDTGCTLNTFSDDYTDIQRCEYDLGCPFTYRGELGIFSYNFGEPQFYRKLKFSEISANELLATATVYWNQGSVQKSVSISTYFFKWN